MFFGCPGSQHFKVPYPDNIKCPFCGGEVEIWSDEFQTKCGQCGKSISKVSKQSCLDWCKYARECVGGSIFKEYKDNRIRKMGGA
ncbi:MAG: hypothetical protein NC933_05390 [Candidatus Omnitrophica bacterium]|nr:hypothetical protein [Candidatus Omnitrophota bacterium]